LCVSKDGDKKLAAEVLPNSIPEHREIVNNTAEAMLNSVPQQGEIINEAAEAMPNSVPEQGEFSMKLALPTLMFVVLLLVTML